MNKFALFYLPPILFYVLLIAATYYDIKSRRIPNRLVFFGSIAALLLHTFIPTGSNFFNASGGGTGFFTSLYGFSLGLAMFFPMYALRALGAGDVKFIAMIGAFTGPNAIVYIAIYSMLAGGLLAILAALWNRTLIQVAQNIYYMATHSIVRMLTRQGVSIDKPVTTTGRLPYACAISSGTLLYIALNRSNWEFPL